jgi:beta-glucanase (GH16 family)
LREVCSNIQIDIEFAGADPRRMLTNVYFNPGDDGTAMDFGYRGSPWRIDLGFDATADFHLYAIDWRPDRMTWLVDGKVVHERAGWDPTPIPHLGMRLHANLWAPRSEELAGSIDERTLPAAAAFRNVSVSERAPRSHSLETALTWRPADDLTFDRSWCHHASTTRDSQICCPAARWPRGVRTDFHTDGRLPPTVLMP